MVDGDLSDSFTVDRGVRQGCPASPLIFSLFLDRIEEYIRLHMDEWDYDERESVRMAGLLLPLLLFADDMVLVGRSVELVQRLLGVLSNFCWGAGLTVNLDKTVWMVGGEVAESWVPPTFYYREEVVKRVMKFKYLGLVTTGHGMGTMMSTRLTAARQAWAQLLGILAQRGWRDRAIRLLLLDTYVKTCLLYGCAVWGSTVLSPDGDVRVDRTRAMGVFYRGALRTCMGLGRGVRNEVLHILSGRWPLQLYVAKAMHRYAS